MSLLEVLSDNYVVCREKLLSFLDINDLLRLRRVSKPFKYVAEDFIRTKKVKTSRVLDIDFEESRPFEKHFEFEDASSFLPHRVSLAMSNYMHRRAISFSTRKLLQCFLSTCGATDITTLDIEAIQGIVIPLHSKRWIQLFDSFPNVTHLKLRDFPPFHLDQEEDLVPPFGSIDPYEAYLATSAPNELEIPTGFKNLNHLELCPILWDTASMAARQTTFAYCVKLVGNYISNLERLHVPFEIFLGDWGMRWAEVMRFACTCLFNDHNVKLERVDGSFIEDLLETNGRTPEMGTIEEITSRINAKVVSIRNPDFMTFFQELPNLEKLEFEHVDHWMMPVHEFLRPEWPKLAEIHVCFRNINDQDDDLDVTHSLTRLWDFLFVGITRKNVVELKIDFIDIFDVPNPIYSGTIDILASCPNLKILRLATNVRELLFLPELWKGLQQLEELHFFHCPGVSDADFVGEDDSSPAFWELKRLKVLDFFCIEEMDVTDEVFSKVFSHMPLKELHVFSAEYADTITLNGIKSLLNGIFATTIERLSLELAGVSTKEQDAVEKLFRSSQMI